jgi:hypothetical protein
MSRDTSEMAARIADPVTNSFDNSSQNDIAFLSGLCAAIAVYCCVLISAARAGLESSLHLNAFCLSVALSAVFSPFLFPRAFHRSVHGRAVISLTCLLLIAGPVIGYWIPRAIYYIYSLLAVLGTVAWLRRFRPNPMQIIVLILLPVLVAFHLVSTMQAGQMGVNIFGPEFAKLGWFTSSAYFHAAIAHLAESHQVISSGLDGFFPQKYHFGSHIWFGALAKAGYATPLLSYPSGYLIIVMPALLLSAGLLIIWSVEKGGGWVRVLLFAAILAVFERLSFPAFLVSESYAISLFALVFCFPLVSVLAKTTHQRWHYYLSWPAALLILVLLTITKVSTGIVWAGIVCYWALRIYRFSIHSLILLVGVGVLLHGSLFVSLAEWSYLWDGARPTNDTAHPLTASFPGYLQTKPWTFTVAIVPPLFLLISRLRLIDLFNILRMRYQKLDASELETVSVLLVIGIGMTTLYIGQNDSIYFLIPAQWLALIFIAATVNIGRESLVARLYVRLPHISSVIIAVVLLWFVSHTVMRVQFNINATFETARHLLKALKPEDPEGHLMDRLFFRAWVRNIWQYNLFDERFSLSLEQSTGGKVVRAINSMIGSDSRDGIAVFITEDQHQAWENGFEAMPAPGTLAPPLPRNCGEPYFVQALVGLPLIQGIPPFWRGCDTRNDKIYWGYELVWRALQPRDINDDAICALAKKKGFGTILILRSTADFGLNRMLKCQD